VGGGGCEDGGSLGIGQLVHGHVNGLSGRGEQVVNRREPLIGFGDEGVGGGARVGIGRGSRGRGSGLLVSG
jgi:hypothetical protein